MGNTESNVTSGVKQQAGTSTQSLYKLINLKGGGLLVDMMKRACASKQYAEIDHAIKTKVEPYLYKKGAGKYVPITKLILLRNIDRPKHKQLPEIRVLDNPFEEFDFDQHCPDVSEAEYYSNPDAYKLVCWNLKERGAVGETILHLCLLNASSLHAELAKRLLKFYPLLINDTYMADEYYGENCLHIAIVNEDPSMVKYLLDAGANVNQICCGNFMCPEDQKPSRYEIPDKEYVGITTITNYEGYVYWGEYPLSFAACLGQEECYRLVLAKGADPDAQDTNGNTVLHMLVIYEKVATFDMAYEVGSLLGIRNKLNLTPLTLAAKIGRVDMFFHILNLEREIYWQLGSITCAAYPLSQIDTIDIETGKISKDSALNLVVFGDKDEHLELMDGVLVDLLKTKWDTFVRSRFYRQFYLFSSYFLVTLISFTLRPGPSDESIDDDMPDMTQNKSSLNRLISYGNITETMSKSIQLYISKMGPSMKKLNEISTEYSNSSVIDDVEETWITTYFNCPLLSIGSISDQIRLIAEMVQLLGAIIYILAAARESRFLGYKMFIENLMTAPSRVMFLFSCCIMMSIPFLRFSCYTELDDHLAVVIMLTTAPYFLFFCRGFKSVGPFVVMIYRMVTGDLLRFVSIYLVFVMGFSQAYYIIFLSHDAPPSSTGNDKNGNKDGDDDNNPVPSPMESIVAMFLMSLTNFGDYYSAMDMTNHEMEAKLLFVLFMVIVAVLLVNMLIAMMGNTYQKIAETRNEWQRQWARIVLVVERGVAPAERLKNMLQYSQPMSDGRRALVLRLNMNDEDKEEMKEILEMKRVHERLSKKRQKEREIRRLAAQQLKDKWNGSNTLEKLRK